MPLPVIVSCTMFWISASLSCPRRVVVRTLWPTLREERITTGTNSSTNQRHRSAGNHNHGDHDRQGKELLQKIAQNTGHSGLHPLHVVDERRDQRARRVALEERGGAAQDRVVKVVAQVRDHSEPGLVGKQSAKVVADRLNDCRTNKSNRNNGPRIVKMVRNEELQIDDTVRVRDREHQHLVGRLPGAEHVVDDGLDEQDAQPGHRAHHRHQHHRRKRIERVRARIAQQPPDAPHAINPRFLSPFTRIQPFYCFLRTGIQRPAFTEVRKGTRIGGPGERSLLAGVISRMPKSALIHTAPASIASQSQQCKRATLTAACRGATSSRGSPRPPAASSSLRR